MRLADRLRAAGTRADPFLVGAILLQWLSTVMVALRANHDGWRFEQSPEAIASVQGAFDLVDGDLPREGPGILWPIVLSPIASVADTMDGVLAGAVLLNVLVLAPLALVAAYWVAAQIGGRLFGVATVAFWVLGPWLLLVVALDPYDPVVRDRVLPLVLGLTASRLSQPPLRSSRPPPDLDLARPSLAQCSRARGADRGCRRGDRAAKPALPRWCRGRVGRGPPHSGGRRVRHCTRAGGAGRRSLAGSCGRRPRPALVRPCGLGPVQRQHGGLREFFWSQRLLQWLPLAGAIAVGRRSVPLALLLGGWMLSFGVVEGSQRAAGLGDGGIFRVLLPALPAYVLLAAAVPLLFPTLAVRLGARLDPLVPRRRPGWDVVAIAAVVLAAVPLATAALGSS